MTKDLRCKQSVMPGFETLEAEAVYTTHPVFAVTLPNGQKATMPATGLEEGSFFINQENKNLK